MTSSENGRFRSFGDIFNANKSTPVFTYGLDSGRVYLNGNGMPCTGAMVPVAVDSNGALLVSLSSGSSGGGGVVDSPAIVAAIASGNASLAATSISASDGFVTTFLGKTGPGEAHSVFGYNSGNSQFLHIFDGTGINGSRISTSLIGSNNNFFVDFSSHGTDVENGIFTAVSSTPIGTPASGTGVLISVTWK